MTKEAKMTAPLPKCKQQVYPRTGFPRPRQCRVTAWKDGYCKVHHPDSVKARDEKQKLRWEAERENSPATQLRKQIERNAVLAAELEKLQKKCDQLTGMKFSDRMHAALASRAKAAQQREASARTDRDSLHKEWEAHFGKASFGEVLLRLADAERRLAEKDKRIAELEAEVAGHVESDPGSYL